MLTLTAPGSPRKLGDNGVSLCEKAEQPRRLVREELGKKERLSGICRTRAPDNRGQTTEGSQRSSQHWWDDRRKSDLKDMEVGTGSSEHLSVCSHLHWD